MAEGSDFRDSLNDEEKDWLTAHPVIRYAVDPNYAPIEFIDRTGQYAGIGADYLNRVSRRLQVRFVLTPVTNWGEALSKLQSHQADLLPAAVATEQRREYLLFANPHIFIPTVLIAARHDLGEMSFPEMVQRLKVAVAHGNSWEERLVLNYPTAQLIRVPDDESALRVVSDGVADVMIGTLATSNYFINKNGITNLRMVRSIEPTTAFSMAVRNDWPMLRGLLNKALANLSEEEKRAIDANWAQTPLFAWWHNRTYQLTAIAVAGIAMTLFLAILASNRVLVRKVRERTQELEEAQLRLIQSAKLESVGKLAAGVAHEVKNPLAIIQLGLDYLAADTAKESEGGEVIADMQNAVQRADNVVKALLDFSREKKLDLRPVDLNEILRTSLKLVHHELVRHDIQVVESLEPNLPRIKGDPNKLEQVFINLFMNAVQAMGREGTLSVATDFGKLKQLGEAPSVYRAKFAPSSRVVRLRVKDTGSGIDPAKLGKVFDPFFTTKPVGQGTGLGLSVSRTIVDLHDGVISLRNLAGGGVGVVLLFHLKSV